MQSDAQHKDIDVRHRDVDEKHEEVDGRGGDVAIHRENEAGDNTDFEANLEGLAGRGGNEDLVAVHSEVEVQPSDTKAKLDDLLGQPAEYPSRVDSSDTRFAGKVRHFTWWPYMVGSAIVSAFGVVTTPLPMLNDDSDRHHKLRIWGLLALGVLTGIYFLVSVMTDVPFARELALGGLLMTSSMLFPVKPVDGAFIATKLSSLVLPLVCFGASVVTLMNLV